MNDDTTSTLRRAVERLDPDVERLVAGGTARGRRLQRRRRAATSLAVVATVGVVAVSAAVVPRLLDDDSVADRTEVADDTTPIPSESIEPTEPTTPPPTDRPDPSVRAGELPALVTSLFPGTVTDAPERSGRIMNGGESFQLAHFLWDGFMMTVGVTSAGGGDPLARCLDNAGQNAACAARKDGTVLLTWGEAGPDVDGGVTGRGVQLYVRGWDVMAIAYNAAYAKDSPVLADQPPFTHAQLTQIVTDPAWFD